MSTKILFSLGERERFAGVTTCQSVCITVRRVPNILHFISLEQEREERRKKDRRKKKKKEEERRKKERRRKKEKEDC